MTKKEKQEQKTKQQPKTNTTTPPVDIEQLTTKLETYLQFKRIPRFQNHRNKIIIKQKPDNTEILIQRPQEPLTPREQRVLLNKTTKTETRTDGLPYVIYTTTYTDKELETLYNNISG